MASTINATTSGVVTTGDSVATLSLQTGGTTAVAIDSAQIVTLSKSLALLGSTSGSVTVAAPATAGTQSYTLPTAQPTADGLALTSTKVGAMSWAAPTATAAGSDTQVQYNNGGTAFGAASTFTFNNSTGVVSATGFSGAVNGTVGATTPAAGTFTTAKSIAAATQDAVQLQGRAGGTGSYVATITPTTLTASRTLTIPDATGTILQSGTAVTVAQGGTGQTSYTDGQLLIGNTTGNTLSKATLTAGSNVTITNGNGSITIAATAGSTSPGGSTTQVQYNNAGAFGGISGFTTDGTRVTASTTIGVGGATPSTSGSGVSFPATQSSSSDVNTLDDYEEGTFTPVIAGTSSAGTATYNQRSGKYVKIGSLVYVDISIDYTSGTGTGSIKVTGLPFSVVSSSGAVPGSIINVGLASSLNTYVGVLFNPGTTDIYPNEMTIATGGRADVAYDATAKLFIGGCYTTST